MGEARRTVSSLSQNRLFRLVRHGERPTHWWLIPLLLLLFQLSAFFGLAFPLEPGEDTGLLRGALDSASYFIYSSLPIAILIGVWLRYYERRPFWTVGLPLGRQSLAGLVGFLLGGVIFSIGIGSMLLTGDAELLSADFDDLLGMLFLPTLVMLIGWAVQGLNEELMFRGWFFQVAGAQIGAMLAVLLTTFFFATAHLANPGISALAMVNLFLIGILFCLLALVEGGIWAAAGFHISWNWIQSNIYGFSVSGLEVGGGSLMHIKPQGADIITGGDFGFEGSIYATGVILIALMIVFGYGYFSRRLKLSRDPSAG